MNAVAISSSKYSIYSLELNAGTGVILRSVMRVPGWGGTIAMTEETMRRTLLAVTTGFAVMAVGALATGPAAAMTLPAPAAIAAAAPNAALAQDVAYVCRRVRRCGPYGCGWHRACWWTGGGPYWGGRRGWRHYHRR
jgi:hypothetical protein